MGPKYSIRSVDPLTGGLVRIEAVIRFPHMVTSLDLMASGCVSLLRPERFSGLQKAQLTVRAERNRVVEVVFVVRQIDKDKDHKLLVGQVTRAIVSFTLILASVIHANVVIDILTTGHEAK